MSYGARFDPKVFSDPLIDMDDYFEWYNMSDERKIRFGKMKLDGSAHRYWTYVVQKRDRICLEPIDTWDEIKATLKDKYILYFIRTNCLTHSQYFVRVL